MNLNHRIRPGRALAALLAITFAVLITPPLLSHEIGTTGVVVLVKNDGTFEVSITADSETLLNRLETSAGLERTPPVPPAERQRRITPLATQLPSKFEISFDGKAATARLKTVVVRSSALDPTSEAQVMITFTGPIPAAARTLTWTYSLTYGSYALAVSHEGDQQPVRQWLEGGQISEPVPLRIRAAPLTRWQVAKLYLVLGFTHIVPKGLDHILFVLGIFLLSTRLRDILSQVTAFTIAHSITLGLSIYGVMSLSPKIVEPLIAISIVYVAVENLFVARVKPWRVLLVFLFGLLHGMGFAGVLSELGLPRSEFATALITFNVGVEFGQLSVIATAWLLIASWARNRPWYRSRVVIPLSCAIAAMGIYWTLTRLMMA